MTTLALQERNPSRIAKCSYTHTAMVDLIVANPWMSQKELAGHFGYTEAWISNVFASDAFQELMARRREEIVDPELKLSMKERFNALVIQSHRILMEKLSMPASTVKPEVALRALELGARAIGMGGNNQPAPAALDPNSLELLANRLNRLQTNARQGVTYEQGQVVSEAEVLPRNEGSDRGLPAREVRGPESPAGESEQGAVRADGCESGPATLQDGRGV